MRPSARTRRSREVLGPYDAQGQTSCPTPKHRAGREACANTNPVWGWRSRRRGLRAKRGACARPAARRHRRDLPHFPLVWLLVPVVAAQHPSPDGDVGGPLRPALPDSPRGGLDQSLSCRCRRSHGHGRYPQGTRRGLHSPGLSAEMVSLAYGSTSQACEHDVSPTCPCRLASDRLCGPVYEGRLNIR